MMDWSDNFLEIIEGENPIVFDSYHVLIDFLALINQADPDVLVCIVYSVLEQVDNT